MEEISKIVKDIQQGNIKPIYLLTGEEPYFIDKLVEYMEDNILTEDEKGFNQMVLYGKETSIEDIVSNAKRYPMMAEKQVVIVKEAQELSKTFEKIASYVTNPQPSTVLIIAYKYKKLDKRKSFIKEIAQKHVLFESNKLKDYHVADWIKKMFKSRGYEIDTKAAVMINEFIGNDLSRIDNELTKLQIIIPKGKLITPDIVEENIGISKDFNAFELRKSISEKNQIKAYQIVTYFSQNSKEVPVLLVTAGLFSYFSNILKYQGLKDKSKQNAAMHLGVNPFFVEEYRIAAQNYPMKKVSSIISKLKTIDAKSKGVGAYAAKDIELYKELLIHIFN